MSRWCYDYPVPNQIVKALHRHRRLNELFCRTTCCGTKEEYDFFEAFKESSKANGIEIYIGWTSNWEDFFPHDASNDLNARFNIDRAVLYRDLIVELPKLEHLTLSCDSEIENLDLPLKLIEFEAFPVVTKLVLRSWPFRTGGPNSLQNRFHPDALRELTLINVDTMDYLFEVLVWHKVQLRYICVQHAFDENFFLHVQRATHWPEFTKFLLQQRSLEEPDLCECDVQTAAIVTCVLQNKTSIKILDLHRHERYPEDAYEHYEASLSSEDIEKIRISCTALEEFSMDLPEEELIAVSPPVVGLHHHGPTRIFPRL